MRNKNKLKKLNKKVKRRNKPTKAKQKPENSKNTQEDHQTGKKSLIWDKNKNIRLFIPETDTKEAMRTFRNLLAFGPFMDDIFFTVNIFLVSNQKFGEPLNHYELKNIYYDFVSSEELDKIEHMREHLNSERLKEMPDKVVEDLLNQLEFDVCYRGLNSETNEIELIRNEIMTGKINVDSVFQKLETKISKAVNKIRKLHPDIPEDFEVPLDILSRHPIIIWGWISEINRFLEKHSNEYSEMLENGNIHLIPLELLNNANAFSLQVQIGANNPELILEHLLKSKQAVRIK